MVTRAGNRQVSGQGRPGIKKGYDRILLEFGHVQLVTSNICFGVPGTSGRAICVRIGGDYDVSFSSSHS